MVRRRPDAEEDDNRLVPALVLVDRVDLDPGQGRRVGQGQGQGTPLPLLLLGRGQSQGRLRLGLVAQQPPDEVDLSAERRDDADVVSGDTRLGMSREIDKKIKRFWWA